VRTAHKVWVGIAATVFAVVAIADLAGQNTTSTSTTETASAISGAAGSTSAAAPSTPVDMAGPAGADALSNGMTTGKTGTSVVTVNRVIDGDTFVAANTQIRVLGIDSCELRTYGGQMAKSTAETFLSGQRITLRKEPGVDRDDDGHALRYVDVDGMDFGETMVSYDHTTVNESDDASSDYLARLREADYDGRTCSDPAPPTVESYEDSGSIDWPSPGDQGLPDGLLTGGFCARHRWC
jgi:endonuclease YncB( thermonuclease family)